MAERGNPNWIKGTSGNPSGRPKDVFKEAIRKQFGNGEQLITWMVGMAQCAEKDSDRIKAIEWLADRGFGKVTEHLEVGGTIGLGGMLEQMLIHRNTNGSNGNGTNGNGEAKPRLLA